MTVVDQPSEVCWQNCFLKILPEIERRLRWAFSRLSPEAREEAIEEATVHCLFAYARLHEQGRADAVSPSNLAWYATLHVKSGRPAAGSINGQEPLSRYAQIEKGIQVEHRRWLDALVEDPRSSVPDQVAAKLDVGAWLATLTTKMQQIARDLAFGFSTSDVARKYGVTAGRISQLRRTLEESWGEFQKDMPTQTVM